MKTKIVMFAFLVLLISCAREQPPARPEPVEQPLVQPKTVEVQPPAERRAQRDELLAKLDEQYESDMDLISSTFKSSSDSLWADCEPETLSADCKQKPRDVMEMCFDKSKMLLDACHDKTFTLIDVADLVSKKHISEWASLTKDLIFYASNSQRDLQEVYQNASTELARDAEEGIQKIKKYSSFRKTSVELSECNFDKYDCDDFPTKWDAQVVFNKCGGFLNDVHKLDSDDDSIACGTFSYEQNSAELSECKVNTFNCDDFSTQAQAQSLFMKCGGVGNDVHHLDQDKDGIACETLP